MKNTLLSTLMFAANTAAQTFTSTPAPTPRDTGDRDTIIAGAVVGGSVLLVSCLLTCAHIWNQHRNNKYFQELERRSREGQMARQQNIANPNAVPAIEEVDSDCSSSTSDDDCKSIDESLPSGPSGHTTPHDVNTLQVPNQWPVRPQSAPTL